MWSSVGRTKCPCFIEELLEGNLTFQLLFIYIHALHFKIRYTILIHFQHLCQDSNHFSKVSNKIEIVKSE